MSDERTTMIGPVGRTVIRNIEAIRKARGLSLRDLAAKLAALGRPIGDTVLHRQSQGKRRIDADDLVAFALALGVNPNALLFDRSVGSWDERELTPAFEQRGWLIWAWANGIVAMKDRTIEMGETVTWDVAEVADFMTHTVPDSLRAYNHPAALAVDQLSKALRAVLALSADNRPSYREDLQRAIQRVQIEVDEMTARPPAVGLFGAGSLGGPAPSAHPAGAELKGEGHLGA